MIVSYFRNLLLADSAINTAVSGRIYPLSLPHDKTIPSIVLKETHHEEHDAGAHKSILTVEIFGVSYNNEYGYDMIHRIGKLVRDKLKNHRGSDSLYHINAVTHKGDVETQSSDFVLFIMNSDYDVVWEAK